MGYKAEYSDYNEMNRFENLDSIEDKILQHLLHHETKHTNNIWKLLKHATLNALSEADVSLPDRLSLINKDTGYPTDKRVFLSPFVDDAWAVECSSLYIFVDKIKPIDHTRAAIYVTVETVTHSKISVINGDGDSDLNPDANPNDSDINNEVIVDIKNRETVLVKSLLAELNGLYLDGIGYLQMNKLENDVSGDVSMPLFNGRSYYGHRINFVVEMSGISESADWGY